MQTGAVARRYAEAIMEIALQQGTVDRWLADIRVIGEAYGNRQLAFVLREPHIPGPRKEAIVRDLLSARVQHEALSLALVLMQDGLVEIGPRLAQEFERLYDEYRGQAKAQVTTAMPLDADERASITADLQRLTGKRILLEERVDPSILGGVVARVGDTLIDGSVRRRLTLLREQIVAGGSLGGPLDGRPAPDGGPDGSPSGGTPGGGTAPFTVAPVADATGDGRRATPPTEGSSGSNTPGEGPSRGQPR